MEIDKEYELLFGLWENICRKTITFRNEGDMFLTTITDSSPINYIDNGNICVLFVNAACLVIYELLKRKKGDILGTIDILMSHGLSHNEASYKIKNALNILNGKNDHIKRDFKSIQYPYFAHVDITSKCNQKCVHCLNPTEKYKFGDLNTEIWLRAINQFFELGIHVLWIGGGEPLLREDIISILAYAKRKNMRIVLATNGVLLEKYMYTTPLLALIDEITICLDGSKEAIHGFLRKPENVFNKIITNIKQIVPLAHENSCLVKIFTCVAKHNLFDISNIIDLSFKLGADSWACQAFVPMNRGKEFKDQVITYHMRTQLAALINNKKNELQNRMHIQHYIPLLSMEKVYNTPRMECSAGNAVIYVGSDGNIFPCSRLVFDNFLIGNIRESNLKNLWVNSEILDKLRNIDYSKTFCGTCQYLLDGMCNGGCKAEKFRKYNDIFSFPDPGCRFSSEALLI
jgi:radical SAM protein with 4Fe4S-binding SPASM domain